MFAGGVGCPNSPSRRDVFDNPRHGYPGRIIDKLSTRPVMIGYLKGGHTPAV